MRPYNPEEWKNRQPPEEYWYKPEISPDIRERVAKEKNDFQKARAYAYKLACRYFPHQYNRREAVDEVFGEGYGEAFSRFQPERGGSFWTLLNTIYKRMFFDLKKVCPARRRCRFSVSATSFFRQQIGDHDFEESQQNKIYVFDLSGPDARLPCQFISCHLRPCGHIVCQKRGHQSLTPPQEGRETQYDFPVAICVTLREYINFLKALACISDDELQQMRYRYLPTRYRQLRGEILRKVLAKLDVQIVTKLIGTAQEWEHFDPTPKKYIQSELEISRYFYENRIQAILERLELSGNAIIARREKRDRRDAERMARQ